MRLTHRSHAPRMSYRNQNVDAAAIAGYALRIMEAPTRAHLVAYLELLASFLRADPRWPELRAIGAARLQKLNAATN